MKRMVDEKEVVKDIEAVAGGSIKVVQLDGSSKTIPVASSDDFVTLTTDQTITGEKLFDFSNGTGSNKNSFKLSKQNITNEYNIDLKSQNGTNQAIVDSTGFYLNTTSVNTYYKPGTIEINTNSITIPRVQSNDTMALVSQLPEANPTVPSGTTPTALTGLKVGSDYYSISGGSAPTNMVTTDTAQTITADKTFDASKLILKNTNVPRNPSDWFIYHSDITSDLYIKHNIQGSSTNAIAIFGNSNSTYSFDSKALLLNSPDYDSGRYVAKISCMSCDLNLTGDGFGSRLILTSPPNGAIVLSNLPTTEPTISGAIWNDNGVIKIKA